MERLKLKFNFSYSILLNVARKFNVLIDRDIDELNKYGIYISFIQKLKQKIEECTNFPIDEYFEKQIGIAVARKNIHRTYIQTNIYKVWNSMGIVYGKKSGKYATIFKSDLNKWTDTAFCRHIKFVLNSVQEDKIALESIEHLQIYIDDLSAALRKLDLAIDEVLQQSAARSVATEQRTVLANELYELLVYLSKTGKSAFQNVSAARYEDYLIYEKRKKKVGRFGKKI